MFVGISFTVLRSTKSVDTLQFTQGSGGQPTGGVRIPATAQSLCQTAAAKHCNFQADIHITSTFYMTQRVKYFEKTLDLITQLTQITKK